MDKKIRAKFFSRRFSLVQGTILGQIDEELEDDVFVKLLTANFLTVSLFLFIIIVVVPLHHRRCSSPSLSDTWHPSSKRFGRGSN